MNNLKNILLVIIMTALAWPQDCIDDPEMCVLYSHFYDNEDDCVDGGGTWGGYIEVLYPDTPTCSEFVIAFGCDQQLFYNNWIVSDICPETCGECGCTDESSCNYDEDVTIDDDSCLTEGQVCPDGTMGCDECGECGGDNLSCTTYACWDYEDACNWLGPCPVEPFTICVDDGSCEYAEENYNCNGECCTESDIECGYMASPADCAYECGGSAVETDCGCGETASDETTGCCADGLGPNDETPDCAGECGGSAVVDDCDECNSDPNDDCLLGCTDESACNYDENAIEDDGSCDYEEYFNCYEDEDEDGYWNQKQVGVLLCDCSVLGDTWSDNPGNGIETLGCTDESACNYDAVATEDDSSCEYAEENYDCYGNCIVELDCFDECGGSAEIDECGECGGDSSSCEDCAGVPNGGSVVDNCGTCDSDSSNDCTQDCSGEWGGDLVVDECGECDGDGIDEGACDCDGNVEDCADECGGSAVVDDCDECNSDPNDDCVLGCNDESACNYDSSATEGDDSCEYPQDFGWCNCYGDVIDECYVCGGDNSSCIWTDANLAAEVQEINTIYLSWDAVDLSSSRSGNGDRECSAEVCLNLENVDTDAGTLDIYMINTIEVGGFQFDLFGITVTDASAPDGFMVSTSATTILAFSLTGSTIPIGEGVLTQVSFTNFEGTDICFGEDNSCAGAAPNVISDAAGGCINADWGDCVCPAGLDDCGVCNGANANMDDCGVCGGDNSSCEDCAGVPNGDNEFDNCGICDNDSSNDCDVDCSGEWGGSAELDDCGVCNGPGAEEECWDQSLICDLEDCPINPEDVNYFIYRNGMGIPLDTISAINYFYDENLHYEEQYCYTIRYVYDIGQEEEFISNPSYQACAITSEMPIILGCMSTYACNYDESATVDDDSCWFVNTGCSCEDGAGALIDNCGTCDINSTNDCIPDCSGVWGGSLELDDCGECGGDSSLCEDCAGVPNGGSVVDNCGTCDNDPNNDCIPDCSGVWGGSLELDDCGECGGDSSLCEDCAGVPNGGSVVDNCGTCDNDPNNDCDQDCSGTWGGTAEEDGCGVCGGDNTNCSWTVLSADVEEINNIKLSWDPVNSRTTSSRNRDISDGCELPETGTTGYLHLTADGSVLYKTISDIGGFQFIVDGATLNGSYAATGGDAGGAEFTMNTSPDFGMVLAFSLSGSVIPIGCGTLLELDIDGTPTGLSDLIISDAVGNQLYFEYYDDSVVGGCMDDSACNYNPDATVDDGSCEYAEENYDCYGNCTAGVDCNYICGGDATLDNCEVCDSDTSNDCTADCNGVSGGTAIEDECGICDGPGAEEECWDLSFACELSYCPINPNGVNYFIYRNGMGIPLDTISTLTYFTDENLNYEEQYCYTVRYVENIGQEEEFISYPSNQACAITGEMVIIEGCVNTYACNDGEPSDPDELAEGLAANTDDGTCWFAAPGCGCDVDNDGVDDIGALPDLCGVCDTNPDNDCTVDCFGIPGGTAIEDECGVCGGDNSTCEDCAGTPNGDKVEDCNGDCDGLAYIDQCGDCAGGNTDEIPCQKDCAGFWGGDLIGKGVYECVGDDDNNPSDVNNEADCTAEDFFWMQIGNDICGQCTGSAGYEEGTCEDDCGVPFGTCNSSGCIFCDGNNPGEDFIDCGIVGETIVCETDATWNDSLGNEIWDPGEEYTDQNYNGEYDNEICDECADCMGDVPKVAKLEDVDDVWFEYWGSPNTPGFNSSAADDYGCCASGDLDACGVCEGPGDIFECGCTGLPYDEVDGSPTEDNQACSCDGSVIEDDCGYCGGSNYFMLIDNNQVSTGVNCDESTGHVDNQLCVLIEGGSPSNFCDCDGNVVDDCGVCGGGETNPDNCEPVYDCAQVEDGSAELDECGNCYDGAAGLCWLNDSLFPDLDNKQSECIAYGECFIDGITQSTWDFAGVDTTTDLHSQELCEDFHGDGANVVGACKVGGTTHSTWDFGDLDDLGNEINTALTDSLCTKLGDDTHQIVGECTVTEWIFEGSDTPTVLNTAALCLAGTGSCLDTDITDQANCDCMYGVGTWEPSQWIDAIWHSSVWIDAIWDPNTSDEVSCELTCYIEEDCNDGHWVDGGCYDTQDIAESSCIADCAGDVGGSAYEDECGTCDTDQSNDCVQDCAGFWDGDWNGACFTINEISATESTPALAWNIVEEDCERTDVDDYLTIDDTGDTTYTYPYISFATYSQDGNDECDVCGGDSFKGASGLFEMGVLEGQCDCLGMCSEEAYVFDNCGSCDADSSNDCDADCSITEEECNSPGEWDGEYCWGGEATVDCNGICGGPDLPDDCGDCTTGVCDLDGYITESDCTDNDGNWTIEGTFFTEGSEDKLSTIYGCENFDSTDEGAPTTKVDCENLNGEWGLMGSIHKFLNVDGKCDCNDNILDCDGVCGGENYDVSGGDCVQQAENENYCSISDMDECGICYGEDIFDSDGLLPDSSCDCYRNIPNCFGECPTIKDLDGIWISNPAWEPITGEDVDGDGICDDQDDCVSDPDNNKHLFYKCEIDVNNGICPEENVIVAFDSDGNPDTKYGGYDICGICNGDGFSCGFTVEGGVNEIKLSWRKPYDKEIDSRFSSDTTMSRVRGNRMVSFETNSNYTAVGSSTSESLVTLEKEIIYIDNVAGTGTLEIYMTNIPGCTYCTDSIYDDQSYCEEFGNNGTGADWIEDPIMSDSNCDNIGGQWFDGYVGGFQFQLFGIIISDATAEPAGFTVSSSETTVLGFSITGATIPITEIGEKTLLTTVTFTTSPDYDETGICFGEENSCEGASPNVISDSVGGCIDANWEPCYCSEANPIDECGVCGGNGLADVSPIDNHPDHISCDCDGNVDYGCGCGEDAPSELCIDHDGFNWAPGVEVCDIDDNNDGYVDDCPPNPNAVSYNVYWLNSVPELVEEAVGLKYNHHTHTDLGWEEEYTYIISYTYQNQEYYSNAVLTDDDNHNSDNAERKSAATEPKIEGCIYPSSCSYDTLANFDVPDLCWWSSYGCDCGSGKTAELDACGVCDADPDNDGYVDACGVCDADSDNDGYVDDCGVCDADSDNDGYIDGCGDCDADSSNDCAADCSTAEEECSAPGIWDGEYCWGGIKVNDACGNCDGTCSADENGFVTCYQDEEYIADCAGICDDLEGSSSVNICIGAEDATSPDDCDDAGGYWSEDGIDECGECNGDGTSCLSLYNGLIPEVFSIHNIYPNPFNPHANIIYGVPELSQVIVSVYDIQGRKVTVLHNDLKSPGYYEIHWNAGQYSSGVYFIEMLSGNFRQIKRVLHMK